MDRRPECVCCAVLCRWAQRPHAACWASELLLKQLPHAACWASELLLKQQLLSLQAAAATAAPFGLTLQGANRQPLLVPLCWEQTGSPFWSHSAGRKQVAHFSCILVGASRQPTPTAFFWEPAHSSCALLRASRTHADTYTHARIRGWAGAHLEVRHGASKAWR